MQYSEDQAEAYDALSEALQRAGVDLDDGTVLPDGTASEQLLAVLGKFH